MADKPHHRPAAAKTGVSWARMVKTELFSHSDGERARFCRRYLGNQTKPKIMGRWNPYDRFTRKEDLSKFFSGHEYRCCSLGDRERFAKFAIEKTLEGYPDDDFKITGQIMEHEYLTDRPEESGALDDLIPRDLTSDVEPTQSISAAAQSIIAASPNCQGPPVNPCTTYLKMTECGQYGPSKLAIWKSPFIPKLDNQDGRRGLLSHQVTAIVWLLSRLFGDLPELTYKDSTTESLHSNIVTQSDRENRDRLKGPKYFGGILADSMGLGKTLVTVALVDLLIRQKLNVVQAEDGPPKHRPILLIAPNATVANQWVQEFLQVTSKNVLRHIVVSGPGLEPPPSQPRVVHLDLDNFRRWPANIKYMWDEGNPRASKVVLIMTMESWATRTCVREKFEKNKNEGDVCESESDEGDTYDRDSYEEDQNPKLEWTSSFAKEGRGFSLVIVDEAYKVKNRSTKNWRSVYLLERQFTLLITATPCMNTLTDLLGLAELLWTAPEKYLNQHPEEWEEIQQMFMYLSDLSRLDTSSSSDLSQLVAGWPALLTKLVCKQRNARTQNIDLTRRYLKYFETLAMLKRSPNSYLYSNWEKSERISLEGLFPKVTDYTVDISAGKAYDREYQTVHTELLIDYLGYLTAWRDNTANTQAKNTKKKESLIGSTRLLQIASSSLDVYDLNTVITNNGYSTLAPEVAEMREKGVNLLRLAQFLVLPDETKPETHLGYMQLATRNSPILRYILRYISENILTREENGKIKKLLIIEQNLMLALYYELVLQFLGFECRCLHAQLSVDERQKLVDSFNSGDNTSCQILIQLYTVGFAGTNLHKSCSRVLIAAQSHSLPVQWQATHRVIRIGQIEDVTVHRPKLKNSFHSFRESRQIEKLLPELGARAQGKVKTYLLRLLNFFQHEIHDAWHSPDGQRLLTEKNLLEGAQHEELEEPSTPVFKKVKLENGTQSKVEVKKTQKQNGKEPSVNTITSSSSNKRDQDAVVPTAGDGRYGWFNLNYPDISDTEAFLKRRTRDNYYEEFIDLPRETKSRFSHEKNNLRRLLSYANDEGADTLPTTPWQEDDLNDPAVLERALELMLRVRLGASDIAMLPFPMIDLSQAPDSRRKHLQRLLADLKYTVQDCANVSPAVSAKDPREALRGIDTNKTPAQIDKDLKAQARFGASGSPSGKRIKKETQDQETVIDFAEDDDIELADLEDVVFPALPGDNAVHRIKDEDIEHIKHEDIDITEHGDVNITRHDTVDLTGDVNLDFIKKEDVSKTFAIDE
ncbi:hypothetical protein NUW58_g4554 [Xylaria curta]|uniref:Uncharacterized protein n=1 Tax=Xylaria curta TaxID=42375 RepID=A0ACC1P8G2_9PEZI|nr:hypothetical protein NUW58_g4554 [Xylaria curta]